MAGKIQDTNWPFPKFNFKVSLELDGSAVFFQEVSGLNPEIQVIEYRHGDSKTFTGIKMPGISKFSNVTLKKGICANDNNFLKWLSNMERNTIKRVNVTIQLLDQLGNPALTWTLINAWPVKIMGTDLKADGNEMALEYIELAHEGITIVNE
jgi:phage tail-like protein